MRVYKVTGVQTCALPICPAATVDLQVLDPVDGQRDGRARIRRPREDDVQLIGAAGGPLHLDAVALVPAEELQRVALAGGVAAADDDGVGVCERERDEGGAGAGAVGQGARGVYGRPRGGP